MFYYEDILVTNRIRNKKKKRKLIFSSKSKQGLMSVVAGAATVGQF